MKKVKAAVMKIKQALTCSRKAALQQSGITPAGSQKAIFLGRVFSRLKENFLRAGGLSDDPPISIGESEAQSFAFSALDEVRFKDHIHDSLLPSEATAEMNRLAEQLYRLSYWASEHGASELLLVCPPPVSVTVLGDNCTVSVDLLARVRGGLYAVRFKRSAPTLSMRGRSKATRIEFDPELLSLQLAGEKLAATLPAPSPGDTYDLRELPVSAVFVHFKGKNDKSIGELPPFEDKPGSNLIVHRFSEKEVADMAKAYADVYADPASACTSGECAKCPYQELCKTEFPEQVQPAAIPAPEHAESTEPARPVSIPVPTPQQNTFLRFTRGHGRIAAVAGSGKTTAVVTWLLCRLEEGCRPEDILVLTFTDKARTELRQRLSVYAQSPQMSRLKLEPELVRIETFNSLGQSILTKHAMQLGYSKAPQVATPMQIRDVVCDVLDKFGDLPVDYRNPFLDLPNCSGGAVLLERWFSAMKADGVAGGCRSVDEIFELLRKITPSLTKEDTRKLIKAFEFFNQRLKSCSLIEYEDQLTMLNRLLTSGKIDQELPVRYLLVDEFQDSDENQIGFICGLANRSTKLEAVCVVGDELQSIYGFRNVSPENLIKFDEFFPDTRDFKLCDNFRSVPDIVELANRLLSRDAQSGVQITAHRKAEEHPIVPPVQVCRDLDSSADETARMVEQVKTIRAGGVAYSDIAVEARTRSELTALKTAFDAEGIPSVLRVPQALNDNPLFKALLALASFLHEANGVYMTARDCQQPLVRTGNPKPVDITGYISSTSVADYALYLKATGTDPFSMDSEDLLKAAGSLIMEMATSGPKAAGELFSRLSEPLRADPAVQRFYEEMMPSKTVVAADGTQGINGYQQVSRIHEYRMYGIKGTVPPPASDSADAVTLITVHSAKGLEWPHVLLSLRRFKSAADPEERRLLYVAITRARDSLLITAPKRASGFLKLLGYDS